MRLLLELPGFWATKNRECLIKTPLQFCVGLVRHLNLPITWSLVNQMRIALDNMGHQVWLPGTPAGYAPVENTLSGSRLLPRYRFAYHCIHERNRAQITRDIEAVVPAKISSSDFIDLLARRLSMRRPGPATRQAILGFLGDTDVTSANRWQHTLDAMYLLACSPEYQLA
jgi:uncharacterized protein (DUF1800 family)